MSMEKKGVIDENTPQPRECCGGKCHGEPTTKEAADQLQTHPINDLIDAVAERTKQNR